MPIQICTHIAWQVIGLDNTGHKQEVRSSSWYGVHVYHVSTGIERQSGGRPWKTNHTEGLGLNWICCAGCTKSAHMLCVKFQNCTTIRLSRQSISIYRLPPTTNYCGLRPRCLCWTSWPGISIWTGPDSTNFCNFDPEDAYCSWISLFSSSLSRSPHKSLSFSWTTLL